MGNLRIAVLGTRGFPNVQGGIEKHCEELYTRLCSLGCQVRVYARTGYVSPEVATYKGVEIYPLRVPKIKSLEALIHTFLGVIHVVAHRKKFDIIHIHGIGPSLLTPVARLSRLKIIVTNHGPDYDRQKWGRIAKFMLHLGEFLGVRFAATIIAISQNIKHHLKKKYQRDSFYIPNGVNVSPHVQAGHALRRFGLVAGKYILAVGRLVPEKGFHDLLNAFKLVNTDWKLVIVGKADHEDTYSNKLVRAAKNDNRVVMAGFLSGSPLSEIYSNAGFFILPSYHEGLPITILEAMSYGLPVLASDIPGNVEIITNNDFIFKPGDISAMKNKILDFIEAPPGKQIAFDNKRRIENEFNWNRIAEDTMKIYKKEIKPPFSLELSI